MKSLLSNCSLSRHLPSGGVSSGTPKTLWKVPYRRNPLFTGRDSLLDRLHATFLANGTAGVSIQTINGLGGIGKTQIALEYAYRYSETYQAVFWISADPQGDMISDFVTIAQVLDLPEKNEPDQTLIIAAIKRWPQSHEMWLLLLDNLEDVAAVNALIPETGNGHVLITTRSQATGSIAVPHEIEPWEKQVGAEFLLRQAKVMPRVLHLSMLIVQKVMQPRRFLDYSVGFLALIKQVPILRKQKEPV